MGPCSNWAHKHLCLRCLALLRSNFGCAICLRQEQIHFIISSVLAHIIKAFYSCMTPPDKKNDSVPRIIPLPSKRGRKKKESLTLVGSPNGTDPLILGFPGQVWQSCIYRNSYWHCLNKWLAQIHNCSKVWDNIIFQCKSFILPMAAFSWSKQ